MKQYISNKIRLRFVDYFRDTNALKCLSEYLNSQWYSPEQVKANEWAKLKKLIEHSYMNVKYYNELFHKIGITPKDIRTMEDFQQLPILTKEIIRRREKDLVAKNYKDYKPRKKFTGGSTGAPLVYYFDKQAHSSQWATIFLQWIIGGCMPGTKMVHLGGPSITPSFNNIKKDIYRKINNWTFFSSFELNDDKMASWVNIIKKKNIKYMHGYSSSAYLLAKYVKENNIDLKFKSVFTSSEPMYPQYRETIQNVFGCETFDLYGANDGGGYAIECEKHSGLHVVSEKALIEIIKDDNTPAGVNESGEMISTDFINYSMPFIRYQVGDVATVGPAKCECMRGTPLIKNIQGRSHEFVSTKNGTKIHGAFFNRLVKGHNWISGFHVIQESSDKLTLYLKGNSLDNLEDISEMKSILEKKFEGMVIDIKKTSELPLSKSGKYTFIENKALSSEVI
ncbi:MAG: phenylacetate--CoA ligase family protein [Ignavibacteriaceae bacterium]